MSKGFTLHETASALAAVSLVAFIVFTVVGLLPASSSFGDSTQNQALPTFPAGGGQHVGKADMETSEAEPDSLESNSPIETRVLSGRPVSELAERGLLVDSKRGARYQSDVRFFDYK